MVKDNIQSNITYYIAYGNRICLLLIYVTICRAPIQIIGSNNESDIYKEDTFFLTSHILWM